MPWGEAPDFNERDGLTPIWPIRTDLQEGRWGVGPATLNELIRLGFASAGRYDKKRRSRAISYLSRQVRDDIEAGKLRVLEVDSLTGVADVAYVGDAARRVRTVWHRSSHDAGANGTDMIRALLGTSRAFPFPKSLYAVEDSLRPLVSDNPTATVVDFFAGSGTTAHAVMRLNRRDGGRRQSISVSNNEVAPDEQRSLRKRALRPGDSEWEQWGICDYITKPRVAAAVTGYRPDGNSIIGNYKFAGVYPMAGGFEENVEFLTLTYEAPLRVSSNREFLKIAPLLWMRAGSDGRRIEDLSSGWDIADNYGVLADLNQTDTFVEAIAVNERARIAFIVTDEDRLFESVVRDLPDHVEPVRLYEAYLHNFEIETGRAAL
ncbi:MAG: DNA methyltransferase [Pseudoclavibacter sp.]